MQQRVDKKCVWLELCYFSFGYDRVWLTMSTQFSTHRQPFARDICFFCQFMVFTILTWLKRLGTGYTHSVVVDGSMQKNHLLHHLVASAYIYSFYFVCFQWNLLLDRLSEAIAEQVGINIKILATCSGVDHKKNRIKRCLHLVSKVVEAHFSSDHVDAVDVKSMGFQFCLWWLIGLYFVCGGAWSLWTYLIVIRLLSIMDNLLHQLCNTYEWPGWDLLSLECGNWYEIITDNDLLVLSVVS